MNDVERTGYFAARDFEADLKAEIGPITEQYGRLFITDGPPRSSIWAQNIWQRPVLLEILSIKDAAAQLRNIQRNWALYDFHLHRRAQLIQENLPYVSAKRIAFQSDPPVVPLGSWTLIDENHILASPLCSSPYRHGEMEFIEDKDGPPNRAYLKLWEFFTRHNIYPEKNQMCLDLGSSPGGWTWVLANLGCKVLSVDKAPLDPRVRVLDNVNYRSESAFGLDPRTLDTFDWLFSDVICYPERLLNLVKKWIEAGKVHNFLCTIKFQGATDHNVLAGFAEIPGSTLQHLYHNKHEVTWSRLAKKC